MNTVSMLLKSDMVTMLSPISVDFVMEAPSKIISDYFEEVRKGDMDNLLKIKSSKSIQLDESQEVMSEEAEKILLNHLKKIDYTINDENIYGEKALVNVTVKGPNITNGMVNTIKESFKKIWSKSADKRWMSEEEGKKIVDDVMIKNFKSLDVDERTADVRLIKNNNIWIVEEEEELCNLLLGNGNTNYKEEHGYVN